MIKLFRRSLSGPDFADGLILKISRDVYGEWPDFRRDIHQYCEHLGTEEMTDLSDEYAPLLIAAVVVTDLQVVKNAKGKKKYLALRRHVIERLGTAIGRVNAEELFSLYESRWASALEQDENPVHSISGALYDSLHIPYSTVSGITFKVDTIMNLICEYILSSVGFTKFALSEYRIGS